MAKKSSDSVPVRIRAAELKKQIISLGGIVGSEPGFEEANPELMVKFYEDVLAEEKRQSAFRPSLGVN